MNYLDLVTTQKVRKTNKALWTKILVPTFWTHSQIACSVPLAMDEAM